MKPSTPPPVSLGTLVETFFRQRLGSHRGVSPCTVATYRDALKLLIVFAAAHAKTTPSALTVADLDRDVVLAFLDHLEKNRSNTARTRNARLAAIRSFFHHVSYADPTALGVAQRIASIPSKRTGRRVLGFLTVKEFDALVKAPNMTTARGRRDAALLLFLGRTGARVSEATVLNLVDVQVHAPPQVLLRGKGSKERLVPLAKEVVAAITDVARERGVDLGAKIPVFANARGQRLTRFGVNHILRRAVAGTDPQWQLSKRIISPHTLRHTTAMHLLQARVDLTVIQHWLGHASLKTTHQYLEADIEMKRDALEKCGDVDPTPAKFENADSLLALLEGL